MVDVEWHVGRIVLAQRTAATRGLVSPPNEQAAFHSLLV